jgi:hypothetical protein
VKEGSKIAKEGRKEVRRKEGNQEGRKEDCYLWPVWRILPRSANPEPRKEGRKKGRKDGEGGEGRKEGGKEGRTVKEGR